MSGSIVALFGGLGSEATGGSFQEGAMRALAVYLFNDMADPRLKGRGVPKAMGGDGRGRDRIDLHYKQLLKSAKDGHLTLDEAIAWWRYGGGAPLTIKGDLLSTDCWMSHCFVTGEDYWVHGQVSINFSNGRIYDQYYDFDMHGNLFFDDGYFGLRNLATWLGLLYAKEGNKYQIQYRYDQ